MLYFLPPDVAPLPEMPPHMRDKLMNNNFMLSVSMKNDTVRATCACVCVCVCVCACMHSFAHERVVRT